jgi:hypothetical protein
MHVVRVEPALQQRPVMASLRPIKMASPRLRQAPYIDPNRVAGGDMGKASSLSEALLWRLGDTPFEPLVI